jgi:hypothetical protein
MGRRLRALLRGESPDQGEGDAQSAGPTGEATVDGSGERLAALQRAYLAARRKGNRATTNQAEREFAQELVRHGQTFEGWWKDYVGRTL